MSMTALVQQLEDKGRNGDTILAHINPEEAQLLKDHGGSGTINPETGIMEFNILTDLWDGFKSIVKQYAPVIIPAIAIFYPPLIPAIGAALGATGAAAGIAGAAALSAGITLASGGSLKDVLTSAALAGASAYMTPVLGKALTTEGAGALTQVMVGSAATGAGYVALRGGSVKEMMAAAATGAASAYLGNLARDSVAKMNNLMASGKVSGEIQQKGATDAVFAAADAANLKAAGLSESQIAQTLKQTGLDGLTADYAARAVTNGMDASTLAANIAAGNTRGVYSGDANTKSITAGNNSDAVQRVEDANFVAADAAQLKAQGLSQAQIAENLMASGVDKNIAATVAYQASIGQSAETIANNMVKSSGYLSSGKVYTNTTDTIARDLGQAMTAEQQKTFDALPLKDLVNNGTLTIDEASVLGQQGVTTQQVTNLTKLGYNAGDISDMIGAGVTPQTLTNLANTKFTESQIASLLESGVSANDISNASIAVNNYKNLTTEEATQLLSQGKSGQAIMGLASDNQLPSQLAAKQPVQPVQTPAQQIQNTGLVDATDAQVLANNGYTATDVQNLTKAGYSASDLADMASVGVKANTLTTLANTPIPESTINNLLMSGTSANDIATTSSFITHGQLTLDQATNLLNRDLSINQIRQIAVTGQADGYIKGTDAGLTPQAIQNLYNNGVDPAKMAQYIESGLIDPNTINSKPVDYNYKNWANTQIANAQTVEAQQLQQQELAKQQAQQPVQPTQPNIPSTAIETVDANGNKGYYDTATGETLDSNGTVISQQTTPTTPAIQEAKLSTNNQQIVEQAQNDYFSGKSPWEDVSTRINNAVQSDINSGYLKPNGDGSYTAPDGVRYFMNQTTGMWDTDAMYQTGEKPGYIGTTPTETTQTTQPVQPVQPTETTQTTQPVQPVVTTPTNDYAKEALNFAGSHGLKTTQIPDVQQALENGYTEKQLDTAFRQNPYGNWIGQFSQPVAPTTPATTPETIKFTNIPIPTTTTVVNPVVPTSPDNIDVGGGFNAGTGQVTPEPVTVGPISTGGTINTGTTIQTQPTAGTAGRPVVVSTSQYTGTDGAVYQQNTMSDGTTKTVLVSYPTTPVGPVQPPVTTQPETPLSPPVQEIIPEQPKIPEVVVENPPVDTTTTTEPPVDTTPYVPILTPQPPVVQPKPTTYGHYTLGPRPDLRIPQGLNPGFITNVPKYYENTTPTQSEFYWGQHPYQPTNTFNPTLYNTIPNAPATPWGASYAQGPATGQQIINAMQGVYPLINYAGVTGPVAP